MSNKKRGRPVRPSPPRIDATPEAIAARMLRTPPATGPMEPQTYRCIQCGRTVPYPATLYEDDCCTACHAR